MQIKSIGGYNNSKPSFQSVHLDTKDMTPKELQLVGSCLEDVTKIVGYKADLYIAKLPVLDEEGKKMQKGPFLTLIPTPVAITDEEKIHFHSQNIQRIWPETMIIEPKFWDFDFGLQKYLFLQLVDRATTSFLRDRL